MRKISKEKTFEFKKLLMIIFNIIITFVIILSLNLSISNISYAEENVVYQKKVEILSTPDVDTKGKTITSRDRDVYEEEQKEEALRKEAESRRSILKDNNNVYMLIIIAVILIVIIMSIYMLRNRNKKTGLSKKRKNQNKKKNIKKV